MEGVAKDTVALLQYLLPGFLAAWVFYGLTSYPKPGQFERVVQALIFALFAQAFTFIEKSLLIWLGSYITFGTWGKDSDLLAATASGVLVGLVFSYCANNDTFHAIVRKCAITRETSYPSEWFGAFLKKVTYVVLHLKDERRLYGWPIEWPSEPAKGHFVLVQASWLDADNKDIPLTGVDSVLVDGAEVRMVEFMNKTWEISNGKEGLESTTAVAATGNR